MEDKIPKHDQELSRVGWDKLQRDVSGEFEHVLQKYQQYEDRNLIPLGIDLIVHLKPMAGC